ncbi:MAG: glycosyltransferase family 39 protein [Candidatus Eisenbacteria bacterium]|nr:glycosyltransferase family 39 protein [Candidatus Eisenbacteria bacterium]
MEEAKGIGDSAERRGDGALVVLLFAAALALRLARIGAESFWLDEAYSWRLASADLQSIWAGAVGNRHTPPLYYAILHLWRVFGDGAAPLRALSAVIGALAVPLFYRLGRELLDRRAGLLAAAAASLSPFLVYYGQEARGYTLLLALILAAAIALLRYVERGGAGPAVLFAAASTLALYTHYYAGFALVAMNLFALFELRRRRAELLLWIALQAAIVLAYLPWAINLIGAGTGGGQGFRRFLFSQIPYSLFRFAAGYGLLPLTPEAKRAMGSFVARNLPVLILYLGVFGALLLRGAVRTARRGRPFRFLILLAAVPYALAIAVSLFSNLISERYLQVSFPFLALLAIEGGRGIRGRAGRALPAVAAALLLFALGAHYGNPRAGKTEWRAAAAAVAEGEREGDLVLVAPAYVEEPFRFAYRGVLPVGGIRESEAGDREALDRALRKGGGARRCWLVISHAGDPEAYRAPLAAWGERVSSVYFPKENGILLDLYRARGVDGP